MKADKNFGQHFLVDQALIQKICQTQPAQPHITCEVGPGQGALTQHLVKKAQTFLAIEKDLRLSEILTQYLSPEQILFEDALQINWSQLFCDQKIWLVSNLPYNVSVPLFLLFLQAPQIEHMTLMFQLEVGEKILPPHNQKNSSSSLMVLGQNYFQVRRLQKVARHSFSPAPEVDSIVLCFERLENPIVELNEFTRFESFLRRLFAHKRKQIHGVLKSFYSPDQLQQAFTLCNIDTRDRAESLSLLKIQKLYKTIHSL